MSTHMNKDDILRMAQEAGGSIDDPSDLLTLSNLERFTALVAEAEREACAKLCEIYETASVDKKSPAIAMIFKHCAAAIRARSKHDTN